MHKYWDKGIILRKAILFVKTHYCSFFETVSIISWASIFILFEIPLHWILKIWDTQRAVMWYLPFTASCGLLSSSVSCSTPGSTLPELSHHFLSVCLPHPFSQCLKCNRHPLTMWVLIERFSSSMKHPSFQSGPGTLPNAVGQFRSSTTAHFADVQGHQQIIPRPQGTRHWTFGSPRQSFQLSWDPVILCFLLPQDFWVDWLFKKIVVSLSLKIGVFIFLGLLWTSKRILFQVFFSI